MALKHLNELDFSLDLHGCEGLDINYVSRIRSQYLFVQHQTMITQMQFADAKAAALIALIGFLALRGPIPIEQTSTQDGIGMLFLLTAGLAVIFTLLSVFPRYPSKAQRESLAAIDRWSWPALVSHELNPQAFADYVRTAEVSQLLHSISISNCYVAKILLSKYRMLRIGFLFGLASVTIIGIKVIGIV